jgi:uncharacterized protein YjbI with pentapeptide repeats
MMNAVRRWLLDGIKRSDFVPLIVTTVAVGAVGAALTLPWAPTSVESIGSALLTGAVLAGVFAWAESALDRRRGEREEASALLFRLSMSPSLVGADLSGRNLQNAYLVGKDLSMANLVGADLSGAKLRGANLTGARLGRACMDGADLTAATLDDASMPDASLVGTVFTRASIRNVDLSDAMLVGAVFRRADLSGSNLRRSKLAGADFRAAVLVDGSLRSAHAHADFREADLGGVELTRCRLQGARLDGCNFADAFASETPGWPAGFHPPVLIAKFESDPGSASPS